MSGSVDLKIYYVEKDGKKLNSIAINEAAEENNWSKSRLILIPIPSDDVPPRISDKTEKAESREVVKKRSPYEYLLRNICGDCKMGDHILWRNVQLVESRFESRFRSYQRDDSACFLQFHTMQAPVLADLNVTLAMVDHIWISNKPNSSSREFVARDEQMLAFINIQKYNVSADQEPADKTADQTDEPADQTEHSIKEIFRRVVKYYIEEDREDAGVTPMLFIAAFLKWYGFEGRDAIAKGFKTLTTIDKNLIEQDKKVQYGNLEKQAVYCRKVNQDLTRLNSSLTGLRSRVNYVAQSARSLKSHVSTMKKYLEAKIEQDQHNTTRTWSKEDIQPIVNKLDNSVFVLRDTDKFDMIERAMQQYQTDIKSLKAHLAINIGLVSNLYAQLLTEKAARDSANMLRISILGVILLPMTFSCIFLTTPILNFSSDHTFRKTPFALFWGISVVLAFCGLGLYKVISFYLRRKRARDQRVDEQDGKKQGKEDRTTWWRELRRRGTAFLLEVGYIYALMLNQNTANNTLPL